MKKILILMMFLFAMSVFAQPYGNVPASRKMFLGATSTVGFIEDTDSLQYTFTVARGTDTDFYAIFPPVYGRTASWGSAMLIVEPSDTLKFNIWAQPCERTAFTATTITIDPIRLTVDATSAAAGLDCLVFANADTLFPRKSAYPILKRASGERGWGPGDGIKFTFNWVEGAVGLEDTTVTFKVIAQ